MPGRTALPRSTPHRTPVRHRLARLVLGGLVVATVTTAFPTAAEAQFGTRPDRRPPVERSRALEIGIRGGIDFEVDGLALGAHLRLPVDPWLRVELMPGFLYSISDLEDQYQIDADAVVLLGPRGAIYAGGGAAFRSAFFETGQEERRFETGYNLVVGFKEARAFGDRSVISQLEYRFTAVDRIETSIVTIGFNFPLAFFGDAPES